MNSAAGSVLSPRPPKRIESLDQLRGYTIVGMIVVNFLSEFDSMPWILKHHREGYSYADTIAPLFLFIVGIGFRLSFLRRKDRDGLPAARRSSAKRFLILIVTGVVLYGPLDWRDWWDALVDIGIAGLLAIPFADRSASIRAIAACLYLLLFQILFSLTPYGPYLANHSFDGGPLGPLSWVFFLLVGTLSYDWIAEGTNDSVIRKALIWGVALSILGWVFRFAWPGLKPEWPFSQRYMTIPYTLYSAGLCFLTFAFFHYACEVVGFRFPHLSPFGLNPLVIYVFHILLLNANPDLLPQDSHPLTVIAMFAGFYLCCYAVAWRLWKDKVVIKV